MRFVEIKEDPRKIRRDRTRYVTRNNLKSFLDEFMRSNIKYARIEVSPNEYKDSTSAYGSLNHCVDSFMYPIQVIMCRGITYLVRTDI